MNIQVYLGGLKDYTYTLVVQICKNMQDNFIKLCKNDDEAIIIF
jgi:hypothetical protein